MLIATMLAALYAFFGLCVVIAAIEVSDIRVEKHAAELGRMIAESTYGLSLLQRWYIFFFWPIMLGSLLFARIIEELSL